MRRFVILVSMICLCHLSTGQCDFNPTIEGETILCPNDTTTLSTQVYDHYQWYKRGFNDTVSTPVFGDTSQTIVINSQDDALFYFSVAGTIDTCTELSPEVLIDVWAFLPVVVTSTGDFTIGNYGQAMVCIGDTMYFTLNLPYNTNITWFKNGTAIPDETSPVLPVTSPGLYTVSGAPDICPEYVQSLGLLLEVVFIDCTTSTNDLSDGDITIYPNPARDILFVQAERDDITHVTFYNSLGQMTGSKSLRSGQEGIDISEFERGIYVLEVHGKTGTSVHKLIIH
ncbi:MAG: T9SS type A sorting domain-containing protein [Saprospiraceae bacterium]|nr:T9SS type A sorting domain-containing protein [Saprospiraceae bacterium]